MKVVFWLVVALLVGFGAGTLTREVVAGEQPQAVGCIPDELVWQANGYAIGINLIATPDITTRTPYPTASKTPTATSADPTAEVTALPTSEPLPGTCEIRIGSARQVVRGDHSAAAAAIGVIDVGMWAWADAFYYTLDNAEWAHVVDAPEANYGVTVSGWVAVTDNVTYDPLGPCLDVPSTHEQPPPTVAPTATPLPFTPTPIPTGPQKDDCALYNPNAYSMRIRDGWSIYGTNTIGLLPPGERGLVGHIWEDGGEKWAYIRYEDGDGQVLLGWTAIHIGATVYTVLEGDCSGVNTYDPHTEADVALLWHAVPGANGGSMLASYGILDSKGIRFGVKPYSTMAYCTEALDSGGICIYRTPPDCPAGVGTSNPGVAAEEFIHHTDWAADTLRNYDQAFIELTNECDFGDAYAPAKLQWWNDFMLRIVDLNEARDGPPLALPGLGPGWGDALMITMWAPALARLAETGGLLAMHAYTPYHDEGLCACDEWLACRHYMIHDLLDAAGIDIKITITEAARGWGNDPVDVADFVCWYEKIRGDPFLQSIALWTAGYHPQWPNANLDNFMSEIANRLAAE